MRRVAISILAVILTTCAWAAGGAKVVINADNVLEIGGKKTFLIGFIMPPPADGKTPDGRNAIDELHDAGATFLRTGIMGPQSKWDDAAFAREKAWQDAAARNGMHCLIGLRYAGSVEDGKPENEAALRRVAETFKDHPGMGAYYGIDEPEWGKHPVEPMERAYRIIKQLDPHHPVWICQAPRGTVESMKRYDSCGDATGGDIYPIGYPPGAHGGTLWENKDISLAGDFTKMMMDVAGDKKPVWMCLQIAWSGVTNPGKTLRFPTFPQQRFMTYQTIITGARGIIYFGGQLKSTLNERDAALGWNWHFWQRVLRPVIAEIGEHSPLYPALVAPRSKLPVKIDATGIEFTVRETTDALFLLACRRDYQTTKVTFTGLPLRDGTGAVMFEEDRTVQLKDGTLTDWFAPFDVHVYRFPKG